MKFLWFLIFIPVFTLGQDVISDVDEGIIEDDDRIIDRGDIDDFPNGFSFISIGCAQQNRVYFSNSVNLSGFNTVLSVSIHGGINAYIIVNGQNRGVFTTVNAGDLLAISTISPSQPGSTTTIGLFVGQFYTSWSVTTQSVVQPGFVDLGSWISGAYGYWDSRVDSVRIRGLDLNNDGFGDIRLGPDRFGKWYVMTSNGNGFVDEGAWVAGAYGNWDNNAYHPRIRDLDVDGDGLIDVFLGPDANGDWFFLRNTGNSYVDQGKLVSRKYGNWSIHTEHIHEIDVNGDGLKDFLFGPDNAGDWYFMKNTGGAFVDQGRLVSRKYGNWTVHPKHIHQFDVNGDGLDDFLFGPNDVGDWYLLRNTGGQFVDDGLWISRKYGNWSIHWEHVRVIDMTGDGLKDILFGPDVAGGWYVLRNTSNGFSDDGLWISAYGNWTYHPNHIRMIDVDGDNLPDGVLGPDANGKWYVLRNSGQGFSDEGYWICGAYGHWDEDIERIRALDVTGNGLNEIIIGPDRDGKWYVLESDH